MSVPAVEEVIERTEEQNIDVSRLQIASNAVLAPAPAPVVPQGVREDLRRLREISKLEGCARSQACLKEKCKDMRLAECMKVVSL